MKCLILWHSWEIFTNKKLADSINTYQPWTFQEKKNGVLLKKNLRKSKLLTLPMATVKNRMQKKKKKNDISG
jgi:hypothetical protein